MKMNSIQVCQIMLRHFLPKARELIQTRILPNLEKLQQDDDADVGYFAMTAHQAWGDETNTSP